MNEEVKNEQVVAEENTEKVNSNAKTDRRNNNNRRPRRNNNNNTKPKTDLEEKVIDIKRVTKVVKGGRQFRFSATVVVGNRKGKVGIGVGKAKETNSEIAVGISGIAGPTGGTETKPVGMVCFGFYINGLNTVDSWYDLD